jgi:lipid-binding SYLF domain-containing protein
MNIRFGVLLTSLFLIFPFTNIWADNNDDAKYEEAMGTFQQSDTSGRHFNDSYGYALFPTIGKGGVGIGAAYGEGRVYTNGNHVGDTSMTQLSIGLQLGGQAYSQIIFFEDRRAFDAFTSGNYEFSADVSAVAITAGASASSSTAGGASASASGDKDSAATAGGYNEGLAVYTIAQGGLMYQVSVGGQKFKYTSK